MSVLSNLFSIRKQHLESLTRPEEHGLIDDRNWQVNVRAESF